MNRIKYKINFSNEWFVVTSKCPKSVVIIHEMSRDTPTMYKTVEQALKSEVYPHARKSWNALVTHDQAAYKHNFFDFVEYYTSGYYINPVTGDTGMSIIIKKYSINAIIKYAQRNAAWPFKLRYVESVKGDD